MPPARSPAFSRADEEAGGIEPFRDAALYDFEYRRRRADVNFYRTLAAERGGAILDMACGSGRLLIPLLRDGHTVVGFDRSPAMLARARARLERLPASRRARGRLVRGDLRRFDVGGGFAFAVSAFHSLQHLMTEADLVGCLTRARQALVPGGWLAFDLSPPDERWLRRDPDRRWARTRFRHPETGRRFVYTTNHRYDPRRHVVHMRLYYQPLDEQGRPAGREKVVRLAHRMHTPADIARLAAAAGLRVIDSWGGFDGRPQGPDADEHIYLLTPVG